MTNAHDNDELDFAMFDAGRTLPAVLRTEEDAMQARLENGAPLAPTSEWTTKAAIVAEVQARGRVEIVEFSRSGHAYVYVLDQHGWRRFSARKLLRNSPSLNETIWQAAQLGLPVAVCPVKPCREVSR